METVKLLLSKHHDMNPSELPPTDKAKNTVLHMSVIGNHSMVKELLQFMRLLGYTTDQLQELVGSVNVVSISAGYVTVRGPHLDHQQI